MLLHSHVKIESPRLQRTIVQCHRYQQYGHTKTYCTLPAPCVKCGEEHTSNRCTKTRDDKPKCGLYDGKHTASYKGCPTYKKLLLERFPAFWAKKVTRTGSLGTATVPALDHPSSPTPSGLAQTPVSTNRTYV